MQDERRQAEEAVSGECSHDDQEEIDELHRLALRYLTELQTWSLPKKHKSGTKLADGGARRRKQKRFNPLVQIHQRTPEQKMKAREERGQMQKRAFEVAKERVEKEERRKEVQAEKERRRAEDLAMSQRRLAPYSSGGRGYGEADEEQGAGWTEERLDGSAFDESFEQIETAQRQLKGKKAKLKAKKQKKAERMMKDRPKEEEEEEDPFMAKFANVR
ncbi:hypothetical protein PG994_006453 [Apiospora phragmitis]|uniref:Uncharacterized protein n=1 Tax=Apiospora phragmitis TaxID=2905665 RepID=A0ABR1VF84_9PEZI